MQKPKVHLNGTSREELERQYVEAGIALSAALDKLSEAAPHARDYVGIDDMAYGTAKLEHEHRVAMLERVLDDLQVLAIHCADVS